MTETVGLQNIEFRLDYEPHFGVVQEMAEWMVPQIERAILDFVDHSELPQGVDINSLIEGTKEAMASCTYLRAGGELWIGHLDQQVLVYVIASVTKDIDNKLTYHISQAWVRKDFRGNKIVKEWWNKLRKRAKALMCNHLMITSTRGIDSYCRFLGNGLHLYAHLLKEELKGD